MVSLSFSHRQSRLEKSVRATEKLRPRSSGNTNAKETGVWEEEEEEAGWAQKNSHGRSTV